MSNQRVAVAMSGGVDSSVTAALLLEQGLDVVGVTMRLSHQPEDMLDGTSAEADAARVASDLGIRHYVLDAREEFSRCIIDYFISDYREGRTPNPCVRCNRLIKFGLLLDWVRDELGIEKIATGHYARIEYNNEKKKHCLLKGVDESKDQSYFLYALTQEQLSRIVMPLGASTKEWCKSKAGEMGLRTADREESQDICFIPDGKYQDFLKSAAPGLLVPGPIINENGEEIGRHDGIAFYTVGQRRGLGIPAGHRLYVVGIDPERNALIAGEQEKLDRKLVRIRDVSIVSGENLTKSIAVSAKIRYNTQDSRAILVPMGANEAVLEFEKNQRAVTPGQSAVFYDGDELLGGGLITV